MITPHSTTANSPPSDVAQDSPCPTGESAPCPTGESANVAATCRNSPCGTRLEMDFLTKIFAELTGRSASSRDG